MSSITYSERIKIETFCELGLVNAQMAERLNDRGPRFLMNYPAVNLIKLRWRRGTLSLSGHNVAGKLN